jgi:REP element-mobilizing transposase RayT
LLESAFFAGGNKFGLRLNHFSVQGNHLHLIVEAEDNRALSRGMQGMTVRMARSLNRLMQRRGSVFADRFHAHLLRTPTETRHAVHYVLHNRQKHAREYGQPIVTGYRDPYSSAGFSPTTGPIVAPTTWVLRSAPPGGADERPAFYNVAVSPDRPRR